MKQWVWLLFGIASLATAFPASGQSPPATGSLTVLSRPSGAGFRLDGPQVVVGRTPTTIARGLGGRYEVRSLEPGFNTWTRTITLSGTGADTVWMTLHTKSPAGAALRSLVLPGWGQFYDESPARGVIALCATAAAGAVAGLMAVHAQKKRGIAVGVLGGVWGINFIDAALHVPRVTLEPLSLGFGPQNPVTGGTALVTVSLRF